MPRHFGLVARAAGLAAFALAAAASPLGGGCLTATQVTVEIKTTGALRCSEVKGIAIVVAPTPAEAEERLALASFSAEVARGECGADDRFVGTLVLTPGAARGAIVLRARIDDSSAATCARPDYKGCIVARRAFSFIDHAAMRMPIALDVACKDVPCDVLSSCRAGTCASSEVQCREATAVCDSPEQPGDVSGGPEGGTDAAGDVTTADSPHDGAVDASGDAPADADPSMFGNLCPVAASPVDCKQTGQTCCYMGSYFCAAGCGGVYQFDCLGRKYCAPNAFCCGNPDTTTNAGSRCDTTNGQFCTQNGNHYICTTDADCPTDRGRCAGVYYAVGTGMVKECVK